GHHRGQRVLGREGHLHLGGGGVVTLVGHLEVDDRVAALRGLALGLHADVRGRGGGQGENGDTGDGAGGGESGSLHGRSTPLRWVLLTVRDTRAGRVPLLGEDGPAPHTRERTARACVPHADARPSPRTGHRGSGGPGTGPEEPETVDRVTPWDRWRSR